MEFSIYRRNLQKDRATHLIELQILGSHVTMGNSTFYDFLFKKFMIFYIFGSKRCFWFTFSTLLSVFDENSRSHRSILRSGVKNLRKARKRRNKNWRASNIIVLVKYVSFGAKPTIPSIA